MWKQTIQVEGPYDFDLVLDRLSMSPLQAHAIDLDKQSIKVPLYIDKNPYVFTIKAVGSIEEPTFEISGKSEQEKATKRLMDIFHWSLPLATVHQHFEKTALKDIFDFHRGTPLVLDFDLYGGLVQCIIHQQLNMAFAQTLTHRFVTTYGMEMDGAWFYPEPAIAAKITVEELRELQFSVRKAEYVIGLSEKIANDEIDLESMRDKSDVAVLEELTKIRGIGRWTVENFLMFGLGRPNLFPKADIGIQNAIKRLYTMETKPTMEQMEAYSQEWHPYLSYASLYLWSSIEQRRKTK